MIVKMGKQQVDVARSNCLSRSCFNFGFDKGTYTQGRGYTSYYAKERPVCMTRLVHGCPVASVCPKCRLLEIDPPGAKCSHAGCDGITVER